VLNFLAVKVFLVNFDFFTPRVPRVASLPFFLVLVIVNKIKIFVKILTGYALSVLLY